MYAGVKRLLRNVFKMSQEEQHLLQVAVLFVGWGGGGVFRVEGLRLMALIGGAKIRYRMMMSREGSVNEGCGGNLSGCKLVTEK